MSDLGYPMTLARAENWGRGRSSPIAWIVVHCTDTDYQDDYPTRLGAYWAREATEVSTHYGISDTRVAQYVAHSDTAYSAREPGNARGVHIEFTGRSAWTRADWLGHDEMLRRGAKLIGQIAQMHGIQPRGQRLTLAQLRAYTSGITCHADLTAVFGGTHTDPGSAFPWDRLFQYLAAGTSDQEDDMASSEEILSRVSRLNAQMDEVTDTVFGGAGSAYRASVMRKDHGFQITQIQRHTDDRIAEVETQLAALGTKLDQVLAALRPAAG